MKELHSFTEVVENDHFENLYIALSNYISKNSNNIKKASRIELSNLNIKYLDITDLPGDYISFRVTARAGIRIYEADRDPKFEKIYRWFCFSCHGCLNNGLHNLTIDNINESALNKNKSIQKLTDNLVPIIPKEQFDSVAEAFLRDCGFGEAINKPMRIPVKEVARRMGLIIKEIRLSQHLTVFGEMIFNDCIIEYYDERQRSYRTMDAKRGTIFLDPNIYFMRNLGCWNNTVIHECFHWYRHRKHHELKGLYDESAGRISCHVYETDRYRSEWTPNDWMEWHANGIAPRILMPKTATIIKIEELINQCETVMGMAHWLDIMEKVVFDMADFFAVSRISAKLRMIELGFKDAEGVATYVDDHYISNYAFDPNSKKRNQTFSISLKDSFNEYFTNPEFRRFIDSGRFTYIDGHYVINDPKYVQHSEFIGLDLTYYAKLNINECCIRFNLQFNPSEKEDIAGYLDTIEFRKAAPNYKRVPKFTVDNHNHELFTRSNELLKFHEEYVGEYEFINRTPQNFALTAWAHIQRLHCDRKDFCEKTLLSEKTYERLREDKVPNPSFETVMQICVGLGLGGIYSEQLLELAGYTLNAERLGYKKVLYCFYGHSIYECDEVLTGLGLPSIIPAAYRMIK